MVNKKSNLINNNNNYYYLLAGLGHKQRQLFTILYNECFIIKLNFWPLHCVEYLLFI